MLFMTFKKILKTSWLSSASVILAGLYYGTLDIWGDEWGWISNYKNIHGCIYSNLSSKGFLSHLTNF